MTQLDAIRAAIEASRKSELARFQSFIIGKGPVDSIPDTELSRFRDALELAVNALGYVRVTNPMPDLSYHKYKVAYEVLEAKVDETMKQIAAILEGRAGGGGT